MRVLLNKTGKMSDHIHLKNPFNRYEGYNCFGCSQENAMGLKMEFILEGDEVISYWEPQPQFQGWLNVLHGGIQATLMDEIAAWLVFTRLKTSGVTSRMDIRHIKPIKIDGGIIKIVASLKEMRKNIACIQVHIFLNNGDLAAEATMQYFTYPEKIAREKLFYPGFDEFVTAKEINSDNSQKA